MKKHTTYLVRASMTDNNLPVGLYAAWRSVKAATHAQALDRAQVLFAGYRATLQVFMQDDEEAQAQRVKDAQATA